MPNETIERTENIIKNMRDKGSISEEEYEKYKNS